MAVTPLWHQWRLPYIRIARSFITSSGFSPYFPAPCCRALLPKHLTARNYSARIANPGRSLFKGHHGDGKVGNLVGSRASRISAFVTEDRTPTQLFQDERAWADVESWVVFSDLHLSRRTSDICLQVLQTIHAEAIARKAGIVFLGDFWHARGALPVELLNMAIMELQAWQRPAIFIPGNHDQVNLGGQVHALQVLEAANPYIKVLSSPVEYLGALWLPFRRDHAFIEQAVQQHGSVQAIFAHLDVVGAFLNEEFQAKEGIEPSIFPSDLPVYTGHYHKPHVVKGTQIEYVGSPYQVSAGESNQSKHFLLLDKKWQKIGEIPVDIGPRHFVISQNEGSGPEFGQSIREGDRVRWHLPSNTLDDVVKNQLEELQRRGVIVELVFPIVSFKQRIKKAEHLDAFGLFELYAQSVDMKENVTNLATDMLRSLNVPAKLLQKPQVHCELKSVELEGFGAFLGPIKYPLAERGVRVVSGRNMDSAGADSNGAGKTTLVMAPLWALTGSTDVRPDSVRGLTASEVVHHDAKRARVRVDGTINGTPFTVERIAGRKSGLKFTLDGEDQTCQEIRMTQFRIDELIDTSVLYRTVFQGQHGGGGLLEASDKDFKEELSKYMAMEVWAAVKEHSMKALRNMKTEIEQLEGALRQIAKQHQQLKEKVDMCLLRLQRWEDNRSKQVITSEAELITLEEALRKATTNIGHNCAQVMSTMSAWERMGKELEQALQNGVEFWSPLKQVFKEKTSNEEPFENLLQRRAELAHQVKTACDLVGKRMKMLEAFQTNVAGSTVCDKCMQPINPSHSSLSLLQLEADLITSRQEHQRFQEEYKKGEKDVKDARKVMELEQKARETEVIKLQKAQEVFKMSSATFIKKLNRIRQCIASAQMVLNNATPLLHAADKDLNDLKSSRGQFFDESLTAKMDNFAAREATFLHLVQQLEVDVKTGHSGKDIVEKLRTKCHTLKMEKNPYQAEFEVLSSLCAKAASEHQEKESLLGSLQEEALSLKEIDTAFGLTGVQSYILEGALAEVQERTARYLEMLSGGSLGLLLRPTKMTKSSKVSVEAIDKIAVVRLANGSIENRSLRQLSGGERRRMALALALGYSEFASQRGGVHCNLLVLDEVLQHLDGEGQARVVSMLKGLPQSTVLVVSQAHSLLACSFDLVDWVIKQQDSATVEVAEDTMQYPMALG